MYKLFLCLRYLRSRLIAYFAMLAVALCVAMMLIVVSVMDGFVDKIERAAKGLFSDIIVYSANLGGMGRYEEFIADLKREVPQVENASPFTLTYGILRLPGEDYRQTVQIAGIDLPGRARVSDFEDGLLIQKGLDEPTFDPPFEMLLAGLRAERERTDRLLKAEHGRDPAALERRRQIRKAIHLQELACDDIAVARPYYPKLHQAASALRAARAKARGAEDTDQTVADLAERLMELSRQAGLRGPDHRVILGTSIQGLSLRTPAGETVRFMAPGQKVILSIAPLGQKRLTEGLVDETFSVIDDCETGVSSIDSSFVYVPFRTLQRLNNMQALYLADDPAAPAVPARCSAVHVKVKDGLSDERSLRPIRDAVEAVWLKFRQRRPDADPNKYVFVKTWRQQQTIVSQIQAQRTLVVIMFGIISMVAVVLIFVIFYMIVMQKTWDIGVLKAIGASRTGVAAIFLAYGAAVGLVGAVFGTVGGYYFVHYINPIADWVADTFGLRVWDREFFLFKHIPNEVDPRTAAVIVIGAILAGLIGALIPAVRAGRMQPVEALRYE